MLLLLLHGVQVQPNNYAAFYDDTRQSWSLMFESEANLIQFAKQVINSCCHTGTTHTGTTHTGTTHTGTTHTGNKAKH